MKPQKQFVHEKARLKLSFLKKPSKKEKCNPTKNIYLKGSRVFLTYPHWKNE